MLRNEKGTILPLTLILTLLTATLLCTWSFGLYSQVKFFESHQLLQELNLLEKQCVYDIVSEISNPDFTLPNSSVSKTIYWNNGVKIILNYTKLLSYIDVTYDLYYNEGLVRGKISYNNSTRTYEIAK